MIATHNHITKMGKKKTLIVTDQGSLLEKE
jgi:hypothetical protein